ncbi:MAG: CPBP family intramembrane metalloprotease [Planctomycetota bacterium]|nr:MAG: CPBP family intramembrane metalloprotease [Planctomycetota bacterium]
MMEAMDPTHRPAEHADPSPPYPPKGIGGAGSPLVDSMRVQHETRITARGNPITPPDPGTPGSRRVALFLAILFAVLAIGWQNLPEDLQRRVVFAPPQAVPMPDPAAAAPGGVGEVMARVYFKFLSSPQFRPVLVQNPSQARDIVDQVEEMSVGVPADRVRAVMLAGEMLGAEEALARIEAAREAIESEWAANDRTRDTEHPEDEWEAIRAERELVRGDLGVLETLYRDGPDALDDQARARLENRYGDIGVYASTLGRPAEDRPDVFGSPWPMVLVLLGVGFLLLFGLLGGGAMLVIGLVWFWSGRRRLRMSVAEPGGSVMLETYALFLAGFFVYVVGVTAVRYHLPPQYTMPALLLQWLLILVPFWALLRGMPGQTFREAIGLHRGTGLLREIGAGLLVYLASVPVFMFGVMISAVLMFLWGLAREAMGLNPPPTPSNPIVELAGSGNIVVILFLFTLATIWAPITEELIFRGALYRHARSRMGWFWAALVTALLFAYMHSYGPLMVGPLIALGFMFAFMREWRGSIIPSMTAHFVHNFTVLTVLLAVLATLY